MPDILTFADIINDDPTLFELPVATEAELLEFANKVRLAGGGEVISALLPSEKSAPNACLIANALNFDSEVNVKDGELRNSDNSWTWQMRFTGVADAKAEAIAVAVGNELRRSLGGWFAVTLPGHIGNAAHAFDEGLAFTQYVETTKDDEDDYID